MKRITESIDNKILRALGRSNWPMSARDINRIVKHNPFQITGGMDLLRAYLEKLIKEEKVKKTYDGNRDLYSLADGAIPPEKPARVYYEIKCPVCGKVFRQSAIERNNSQRVTCSEQCERSHRSKMHLESFHYDEETYKKIVEKRSKLPKMQATPDFFMALTYSLISPKGELFEGKNLAFFVRDHSDLFPNEKRAYYGLSRLRPSIEHPRKKWHGWRWTDTDDNGSRHP